MSIYIYIYISSFVSAEIVEFYFLTVFSIKQKQLVTAVIWERAYRSVQIYWDNGSIEGQILPTRPTRVLCFGFVLAYWTFIIVLTVIITSITTCRCCCYIVSYSACAVQCLGQLTGKWAELAGIWHWKKGGSVPAVCSSPVKVVRVCGLPRERWGKVR